MPQYFFWSSQVKVLAYRENALVSHLAETFHVIFGDLSFTQSDRHVALVLATALQQVRRRERIRACLLDSSPARVSIPLKSGRVDACAEWFTSFIFV